MWSLSTSHSKWHNKDTLFPFHWTSILQLHFRKMCQNQHLLLTGLRNCPQDPALLMATLPSSCANLKQTMRRRREGNSLGWPMGTPIAEKAGKTERGQEDWTGWESADYLIPGTCIWITSGIMMRGRSLRDLLKVVSPWTECPFPKISKMLTMGTFLHNKRRRWQAGFHQNSGLFRCQLGLQMHALNKPNYLFTVGSV